MVIIQAAAGDKAADEAVDLGAVIGKTVVDHDAHAVCIGFADFFRHGTSVKALDAL